MLPVCRKETTPTQHITTHMGVCPAALSCSISQLDTLVRQPALPLLVNSATFLKTQLPARLENHIYRLQVGMCAVTHYHTSCV